MDRKHRQNNILCPSTGITDMSIDRNQTVQHYMSIDRNHKKNNILCLSTGSTDMNDMRRNIDSNFSLFESCENTAMNAAVCDITNKPACVAHVHIALRANVLCTSQV